MSFVNYITLGGVDAVLLLVVDLPVHGLVPDCKLYISPHASLQITHARLQLPHASLQSPHAGLQLNTSDCRFHMLLLSLACVGGCSWGLLPHGLSLASVTVSRHFSYCGMHRYQFLDCKLCLSAGTSTSRWQRAHVHSFEHGRAVSLR